MPSVCQHSMRHWRQNDNKINLLALQKLLGMLRQCGKCHAMQGGTHAGLGRGLRTWEGSDI